MKRLILILCLLVCTSIPGAEAYPPPYVHQEWTTNLTAIAAFTNVVKAGGGTTFSVTSSNITIDSAGGVASNVLEVVESASIGINTNSLNRQPYFKVGVSTTNQTADLRGTQRFIFRGPNGGADGYSFKWRSDRLVLTDAVSQVQIEFNHGMQGIYGGAFSTPTWQIDTYTGSGSWTGQVSAAHFSGSGDLLTNLPALASTYPAAITNHQSTAVAFDSTIAGNGSGLSNLTASAVSGVVLTNNYTIYQTNPIVMSNSLANGLYYWSGSAYTNASNGGTNGIVHVIGADNYNYWAVTNAAHTLPSFLYVSVNESWQLRDYTLPISYYWARFDSVLTPAYSYAATNGTQQNRYALAYPFPAAANLMVSNYAVFEGDSISEVNTNFALNNGQGWPRFLVEMSFFKDRIGSYTNTAVAGSTIWGTSYFPSDGTNLPANQSPGIMQRYQRFHHYQHPDNTYFFCMVGINELTNTTARWISNWITLLTWVKADNMKPVVLTTLPAYQPGSTQYVQLPGDLMDLQRQAFNTGLANLSRSGYFDTFVDWDELAWNPRDTLMFRDGIHTTADGAKRLAGIVNSALIKGQYTPYVSEPARNKMWGAITLTNLDGSVSYLLVTNGFVMGKSNAAAPATVVMTPGIILSNNLVTRGVNSALGMGARDSSDAYQWLPYSTNLDLQANGFSVLKISGLNQAHVDYDVDAAWIPAGVQPRIGFVSPYWYYGTLFPTSAVATIGGPMMTTNGGGRLVPSYNGSGLSNIASGININPNQFTTANGELTFKSSGRTTNQVMYGGTTKAFQSADRLFYDILEVQAIDAANRYLVASDGSTIRLNWDSRQMEGPWAITGALSLQDPSFSAAMDLTPWLDTYNGKPAWSISGGQMPIILGSSSATGHVSIANQLSLSNLVVFANPGPTNNLRGHVKFSGPTTSGNILSATNADGQADWATLLSLVPSGSGSQVLRRNAGNSALEFATISAGGGDVYLGSNNVFTATNNFTRQIIATNVDNNFAGTNLVIGGTGNNALGGSTFTTNQTIVLTETNTSMGLGFVKSDASGGRTSTFNLSGGTNVSGLSSGLSNTFALASATSGYLTNDETRSLRLLGASNYLSGTLRVDGNTTIGGTNYSGSRFEITSDNAQAGGATMTLRMPTSNRQAWLDFANTNSTGLLYLYVTDADTVGYIGSQKHLILQAGNSTKMTIHTNGTTYAGALTASNNITTTAGQFIGNGAGVTNMPAASMTGTVTNPIATGAATISGNGSGLTNIPSTGVTYTWGQMLTPTNTVSITNGCAYYDIPATGVRVDVTNIFGAGSFQTIVWRNTNAATTAYIYTSAAGVGILGTAATTANTNGITVAATKSCIQCFVQIPGVLTNYSNTVKQ